MDLVSSEPQSSCHVVDSRFRGNDEFKVGLQPYRPTANRPLTYERKQKAEMLTSEGVSLSVLTRREAPC
jgi:hypothetical protein